MPNGAARGFPPDPPGLLRMDWDQFINGHLGGMSKTDTSTPVDEKVFRHILSALSEIYDIEAVIAGGAVRDLVAGSPLTKDVDVFLPFSWDKYHEHMLELGWVQPGQLLKRKSKKYENEDVPSTARATAQCKGFAVDLVFMEKPLDRKGVESFPIHAQRCVWTLNEGLIVSPEARADISEKTFTIDPKITDEKKLEAINAKIRDWKTRDFYKDWKISDQTKAWWEKKDKELAEKIKKGKEYPWATLTTSSTTW